jgi:hypothetical protein
MSPSTGNDGFPPDLLAGDLHRGNAPAPLRAERPLTVDG